MYLFVIVQLIASLPSGSIRMKLIANVLPVGSLVVLASVAFVPAADATSTSQSQSEEKVTRIADKTARGRPGENLPEAVPSHSHRQLQENVLCQPPDCEFHTGNYTDSYGDTRTWQAYVPAGSLACPPEGCPLYYAFDGTGDDHFTETYHQSWMMAMLARGYVAVAADYASDFNEYGFCYGQEYLPFDPVEGDGFMEYGVVAKARDIFDRGDEGSVQYQLCDGPDALANCSLGVAVSGVSQGSQIALLGSNYDKRVTAALLWATGDNVQTLRDFIGETDILDIPMPCMDTVQLPAVRRRHISGDADQYFGRDANGTIQQIQRMSRNYYDCEPDDGQQYDCLTRGPESVPDAYTGSGQIANEGGYFIVEGSDHVGFLRTENYTTVEEIYGFESSFDWLGRTGRLAYAVPPGVDTNVTMVMDFNHSRLSAGDAQHGLHVAWADANGALGQRYNLGGKDEFSVEHHFCCEQVPVNTIGFRVSAVSDSAAFLDQISVSDAEIDGGTFEKLEFGENEKGGWCFSLDPSDSFLLVDCYGESGEALACVDFCVDGTWQGCDDALESVSKCTGIDGGGLPPTTDAPSPSSNSVGGSPTSAPMKIPISLSPSVENTPPPTPSSVSTSSPVTEEDAEPSGGWKNGNGNVSMCVVTAAYAIFVYNIWF